MTSERLHDRLRRMRSRVSIRKWEVRQIGHARGVWFRFELLLARTRRALAITAEDEARLRYGGFEPHAIGEELEPPKSIFVLSEEQLPSALQGRDVPLQDARQILLEPALVLIPFRGPASEA
jgi:hypothetical protein